MRLIVYVLLCVVLYVVKLVEAGRGKLMWANEFNSLSEIADNWNAVIGNNGFGNNELQYYTPLNAKADGGNLIIEARHESYGSSEYTSSRLLSKQNFTYGVFEIKAKLPRGRGTWPTFWLLSAKKPLNWPDDGEIDVMQHVGIDPNVIYGSIHCRNYNHVIGKQRSVTDVFDQFHTYTLEWGPSKIELFVDGRTFYTFYKEGDNYASWPFDNSMNMVLSFAVGGDWAGTQGIDNTAFPAQYTINYVRVYEFRADPTPTVVSVRKVAIIAQVNNKYVCAEYYGQQPLIADRGELGDWEIFEMTTYSDGFSTLKAYANQKFVSIVNYNNPPLMATKDVAQDWEKFQLVSNSDGSVAFKAKVTGKYVVAESAGYSSLIARADVIDGWEKFTIQDL